LRIISKKITFRDENQMPNKQEEYDEPPKSKEAQKLKKIQPSLIPVVLDITKESDIENAYQFILKQTETRPLVALINNAGIGESCVIEYSSVNLFKKVMDVNAIGHVAVTIKFLPLIMKAKGRIVNVTSIAGLSAAPKMAQYAMSKFAMEAFTDVLRKELFPSGISVSAIEPFFIKTDMVKNIKVINYPEDASTKYPNMSIKDEDQRKFHANLYEKALPVDIVLNAMMDAINSETPKTRYLLAHRWLKIIIFLSRILPDRVVDKFEMFAFKKLRKELIK